MDKTLAESELRKNDITILAILRGDNTVPKPSADTKVQKSDELVLFGKLENIRGQMST
ncbi:cation:proton antiporter regulatory subunit [Planctomycetota bacterium]